jgi:hypothetical protein
VHHQNGSAQRHSLPVTLGCGGSLFLLGGFSVLRTRDFAVNFGNGLYVFYSISEDRPRLRGINETPAVPSIALCQL